MNKSVYQLVNIMLSFTDHIKHDDVFPPDDLGSRPEALC